MNLTLLTRYSRLGASTRLRTLQYIPALEQAGFQINLVPFFDDDYLIDLYAGRRKHLRTLKYYRRRLAQCLVAGKPDLIWIEKEVLPWAPWIFERALLPRNVPYIVDYDDAVFHRYDTHNSGLVRKLLGTKIDRVMAGSACVTVGNEYLASRARGANAQRVDWVPTVVDTERYRVSPANSRNSELTVGWIGTPKTWKELAQPVHSVLLPLLNRTNSTFRAIGASLENEFSDRLNLVPWKESEEVSEIQKLDIGVMPLPDDPWTRGKCGYKLIQYMACGIPVVASPIGVNTKIVQHGVNGFLADTDNEWREAVETLLTRPELRIAMGDAGRRHVEQLYSIQAWQPRLIDIFRSVVVPGSIDLS